MNAVLAFILFSTASSPVFDFLLQAVGLIIAVALAGCILLGPLIVLGVWRYFCNLDKECEDARKRLDSIDTIEFRFEYSKDDEDSDKENPEKS